MKFTIKYRNTAIAFLSLVLVLGTIGVPVDAAFAGSNGITILSYKYWRKDPMIGEVHWHYTQGAGLYESRHRILANKPDGGTGFKYATWQDPGHKSSYGHNLLGGQIESWGDFRIK